MGKNYVRMLTILVGVKITRYRKAHKNLYQLICEHVNKIHQDKTTAFSMEKKGGWTVVAPPHFFTGAKSWCRGLGGVWGEKIMTLINSPEVLFLLFVFKFFLIVLITVSS